MPTRLIQLDTHASGTASLRVTGPAAERLSPDDDLEIAILQPGQQDLYLDPRNPDKPWSTAVFRFRPLAPRRDGGALMLDIDYGVTYHLRANQPYKLKLRQGDTLELEERFTGSPSLRRPSAMPQGWTPPPDPRGPVAVPPPATVVEPTPEPEPPEPVPVPAPVEALVEPAPVVEKRVQPAPAEQKRVEPSPPDDIRKTPVPVPPRKTPWLAVGLLAVVLVGAGAWWLTRNGGPPAPVAQSESDESLAGIRKFLAGNPEPADARARAEALVAKGGQLDSQFLLVKYAAERGDAKAARMMGTFYDPQTWSKEKSPLPAPNPLEAARWHKMAAEAGDAESQYRYGMLLKNGGTDEPNGPEMAVGWLRKAAEQGNAEAKKALAQ
jgi:Sel1 repeat